MLDLSSANDTRVHRPREMEGRQGIVQWEGRKKRRDRKRREDGSRGGNPSTCLSSLLLSIFVFSSLLRGSRSIWEQTNFYHHGIPRIPCNVKFAPQSIDIT